MSTISTPYHLPIADQQLKQAGIVWDAQESMISTPEVSSVAYENGYLPPVSTTILAQILHNMAKVTVIHTFKNLNKFEIPNPSYTTSLPAGSTVVNFTVCRADMHKGFIGRVKSNSHVPLELRGANDDEIFTAELHNIPQGGELETSLSFVFLLQSDRPDGSGTTSNCHTTFNLPSSIAPQCIHPNWRVHSQTTQDRAGLAHSGSLTLEVNVLTITEIQDILCPYPGVHINIGSVNNGLEWLPKRTKVAHRAVVNLRGRDSFLIENFSLLITTKQKQSFLAPFACLEEHHQFPEVSTMMLVGPPGIMATDLPDKFSNREFIFVVDRSGSMWGPPMKISKSALGFLTHYLPKDCRFNVWGFGSKYESLWPQSMEYNDINLGAARDHIQTFDADFEGTTLLPVLKAIEESHANGTVSDVIVITDGDIFDLDKTKLFIANTRSRSQGMARYFALGICDSVSHTLVEGIAKSGGGYAEALPKIDQGTLETRALGILSLAICPHSSTSSIELELELRGGEVVKRNSGTSSIEMIYSH
jgi:hypothetical protein